ncbi:MAG: hypothetical protein GX131_20200, partial [candidate division WS1 bacterium]|nr:hypothetical protein [candidate division WS1 bacterium]
MQTSEHSTTVPLKAIFVSILLVLTAAGAFSAAITVGPTGPPTFDYASIQAAITAASNGDAVQVAAGTYNELVMWDNKDLQLIGAGADVTTINGNSTVPVVFIHDVSATASFSGFTVTGGTTRGGVWLQRSSLTFSDNVITGNHTQADGGGMRIDWGSPTILRNHIYGNSADGPGGGIFMFMCTSPLLVENVIQSNVAPHGGGIFVTGTTNLQITDGVIEHNDALAPARGYGAGMYLANTGAAVEGVTFNYNRAIHGGAIYFADGSLASSLSVGDCLFQGNSASGYGGAIAAAAGASCTIDDSIFASNQAGSGILVMGTPGHVMGCLLHRNTCDPFAPQVLTAAAVTIDRCTLAAPAGCSAMVEATSGALTITNSIVESGYFVGVAVVGTPLNISNSNVYGQGLLYRGILNQTGLNGNISVDPKFASPETADFHLRSAIGRYTPGGWVTDPPQQHSPCIDKADPVADHSNESDWPAGRLNMGAYGNTAEASKGGNVQPYGLVVEVMPASPETTQPLVCSIVTPAVDPNVDPVTYRYEWYEDGVHRPAYDGMTTLPADATEPGNMWKCVVTPTDGLLDGTPAQAEVHISGLIQVPAEYATIQGGIDAAWDGDEVQVASGTYNEDITWAGKDIRVSTRNGGTINGSGQTSVVTISDVPASAKFSNFVVKGGSANNGGGLHVTDSSLEMSLITVSENAAQSRGGGVYIEGGAPTFTNGVVAHSQSGGDGGGIYVINSDASIIGNHLMFNNATGDGGGICIDGGTTKVSQCYIASNTAGRDGGAIVHKSGTSDIYRCKFQYNTSTRNGGAVCIYAPLTRMSENSFVENTLGGGTGVAVGGGVFIDRQAAWPIFPISNNLFAGNRGSDGPAICINDTQGSNWELTNCTMADNVGGAFRIETGSATISNSIVWANTDGTPLQGNIDVDYCCIGPDAVNVGGTDNFNADPLFVDGGVDGYHLKSVFGRWNHWSQSWIVDDEHSPCIDNGDPASDFSRESDPNGGRVNLGAWGNTETASRGGNVPPTQPVVDIQPDAPLTTDDLLLTVVTESTDPNLDPVTLTRRWFLDGVHQADLDDATTVPAGRTVKGQVWRYEMTPNDGQVDGPTGFDELTIGNTVPGPVVAEITPTAPLTTDDLQVSVTGGDDPDDDTITHRYRWSRDGQPQADLDDATTVPAAQTANGETWRCEVTPNDGEADGPTAFDEVTIGNT